jgi:hypothetical protein
MCTLVAVAAAHFLGLMMSPSTQLDICCPHIGATTPGDSPVPLGMLVGVHVMGAWRARWMHKLAAHCPC